jgi:aminoglycoside N3'-acetyltransferase
MFASVVYRIFSHFPFLEVLVRHFYWLILKGRNIRFFNNPTVLPAKVSKFDFSDIINYLNSQSIGNGTTLVVHSSYESLKFSGLRPNQINDALLSLVGNDGNLVMPVNRLFASDYRSRMREPIERIDTFDPNSTRVTTGALGYMLMKNPNSAISLHPISNAVVIGAMSEWFVSENISGILPKPCGVGSVWSKCLEVDAVIVALGTDLVHSLTMTHIVEDMFHDDWPISNWYNERTFKIVVGSEVVTKTVLERKPYWGKLYYAEWSFRKDLVANGILLSTLVSGLSVEVIRTKHLFDFLISKNMYGYPFRFVPKKFYKL